MKKFRKQKNSIKNQNDNTIKNNKLSLGFITQDTTISLLSVGFYIALFTLIIDLFTNLKIFSFIPLILGLNPEKTNIFQGVMSGIIEMTNGAKMLSKTITPINLAFISSIISFSGISIIMQALSFLSNTNIKPIKFVLGKICQSVVCFTLSLLIFSIIL